MTDTARLDQIADDLLTQARAASSRRAADTVYGGSANVLRQTVMALAAGAELTEHESPGEATLQVLVGTVELRSGDDRTELSERALAPIPESRHALTARTDAVILLTVAKLA